jgi:imidazolonepropionase-like amidohydrolase
MPRREEIAARTPEAVMNAMFSGARADRLGTIKEGKAADLVVINGDPSKKITDIEKRLWCSAMAQPQGQTG